MLLLLCRALNRVCALPLEHVSETMRPLPIEPVSGVPRPVLGVAIIRGAPTPVVDLGCLLAGIDSQPTMFVTVNVGTRRVALAVDRVVGVRSVAADAVRELPPLLRDADAEAMAAIGTLDTELLVLLDRYRLVPEPVWAALAAVGATA